jgi:UDP-N-acetylglucosamine--N-acetylmuramyl-(pentapeptide) pyrophosphoryl-undecaprenol N-acetylglucosamine transferase
VNRLAARWASVVATTFAGTAARLPTGARIERTGNPIRQEIRAVVAERDRLRAEAREAFDLMPDRATVLVFGGSQGALHIDRTITSALPLLRDRGDLQLLVSTGAAPRGRAARSSQTPRSSFGRCRSSSAWTERLRSRIWPSRGGGSVAELAAAALPSILVPYPFATENHQEANARELVTAGPPSCSSMSTCRHRRSQRPSCLSWTMTSDDWGWRRPRSRGRGPTRRIGSLRWPSRWRGDG